MEIHWRKFTRNVAHPACTKNLMFYKDEPTSTKAAKVTCGVCKTLVKSAT